MTEDEQADHYNVAEWHGKMLIDRDGEKIGKLQEVYVDVGSCPVRRGSSLTTVPG